MSYARVCDVNTIEAIESGLLDMKDFYFMGDDYRYHFEAEAKRRFLELLKDRFNSGVQYKGKTWKWDTIILNKTEELSRFLLGMVNFLDFTEPSPNLIRFDSLNIRSRILGLTQREAQELGIGRSTLHYLRRNAKDQTSFRVYQKVAGRVHRV
ncbi:MAG: hypothetical protein NTX81_08945 [Candidatus Bathyarchaeota archaeon]|nr:hypothetical protein [Candidatus Bathyarchaeota archaeon]